VRAERGYRALGCRVLGVSAVGGFKGFRVFSDIRLTCGVGRRMIALAPCYSIRGGIMRIRSVEEIRREAVKLGMSPVELGEYVERESEAQGSAMERAYLESVAREV
jgi:hypothetical protein